MKYLIMLVRERIQRVAPCAGAWVEMFNSPS